MRGVEGGVEGGDGFDKCG